MTTTAQLQARIVVLEIALRPFAEEAKNRTELRHKLENSRGYPYPEGECERKYRNFMRDSEAYWEAENALKANPDEGGEVVREAIYWCYEYVMTGEYREKAEEAILNAKRTFNL